MYWDRFEIVFWGIWLSMWPFYWHHMRAIVEAEHFGTHTELRLFLLLTATKLWITSSKHAGKISFPTQVRKKRRNTDITYYYACIRLLHVPHWVKNHFLIVLNFEPKSLARPTLIPFFLSPKTLTSWQLWSQTNFDPIYFVPKNFDFMTILPSDQLWSHLFCPQKLWLHDNFDLKPTLIPFILSSS